MASTHDPNAHLARTFSKEPQAVAECMSRNARSAAAPLILQMQPLYGMEVVGVTVKRRFTGDAFLVATLTATPTGSAVEFRPAVGVEQPPDVLEKLIAGCD